MVLSICIEQPPDHPLILRVVSTRLVLEKLDAALAQCDRDLDPLFPKDQVLGARKEVDPHHGRAEQERLDQRAWSHARR